MKNFITSHPLSLQRSAVCLVAIAACFSLAWQAIGITRADLLSRNVSETLAQWETRGGSLESLAEWQSAREKIALAITLRPDNHEYFRQLGDVHRWALSVPVTDSAISADFYSGIGNKTLDAYRQEAKSNPAWPYSWAMLARTKGQYRQYDAEFDDALLNTMLYGEHVPAVQQQIIYLAAAHYTHVFNSTELALPVLEYLSTSLAQQAASLRQNLNQVSQSGLLPVICLNTAQGSLAAPVQQACDALDLDA